MATMDHPLDKARDQGERGQRYHQDMTGLLQEALRRVESLSSEEQDAIASQIIETLDDEAAWARSFSKDQAAIRSLAREALDEHRRGETRPLDELLG
jgi:3'-phosphoadenosine 5'-phosphosulfate sulfotransferase (PAPS reductase)/FAD synthetase